MEDRLAPDRRPPAVTISLLFWVIAAAAGLGRNIFHAIDFNAFSEPARSPGASALESIHAEARTSLVLATIIAVLYLGLAVVMLRRHQWARVALSTLGVIGVVRALFELKTNINYIRYGVSSGPATTAIVAVEIVATLTALVLINTTKPNDWFSSKATGKP